MEHHQNQKELSALLSGPRGGVRKLKGGTTVKNTVTNIIEFECDTESDHDNQLDKDNIALFSR